MITQERFFGGADSVALDGTGLLLTKYSNRIQHLHSYQNAGVPIRLPDATRLQPGGPWFYILNSTGIAWDISDFDSTIILPSASFPNNSGVLFILADNATSAGVWVSKVMDIN